LLVWTNTRYLWHETNYKEYGIRICWASHFEYWDISICKGNWNPLSPSIVFDGYGLNFEKVLKRLVQDYVDKGVLHKLYNIINNPIQLSGCDFISSGKYFYNYINFDIDRFCVESYNKGINL